MEIKVCRERRLRHVHGLLLQLTTPRSSPLFVPAHEEKAWGVTIYPYTGQLKGRNQLHHAQPAAKPAQNPSQTTRLPAVWAAISNVKH